MEIWYLTGMQLACILAAVGSLPSPPEECLPVEAERSGNPLYIRGMFETILLPFSVNSACKPNGWLHFRLET